MFVRIIFGKYVQLCHHSFISNYNSYCAILISLRFALCGARKHFRPFDCKLANCNKDSNYECHTLSYTDITMANLTSVFLANSDYIIRFTRRTMSNSFGGWKVGGWFCRVKFVTSV